MTIVGILLLGWLAIASGILVVVFIRRLRANGLPEPIGYAAPYLSIVEGPVPHVPPPAWARRDETRSSDDD